MADDFASWPGGEPARTAAELADLGRPNRPRPLAACTGGGTGRRGAGSRARRRLRRQAVLPVLRRRRVGVRRASTSSRTRQPSCSALWRPCRSTMRRSTSCSAPRCSSTATTLPGGSRAAPCHAARRARARLDPRRPGVPPVAGRLLAVDARRTARLFTENAEWRAVSVEPGGGDGVGPRDAARDVRRDRAAPNVLARAGPVWLLNRAGAALEPESPKLREPVPGSLIPNFHVVARV